ncbi:MAG: hypothetical protein NXH95_07940 [Pseudomonadaceae bacterium]|nr:hypothetical protein [Pseudomonadaceae bacterium]
MNKDLNTMELLWQQDQSSGRFSIDEQAMHNLLNKQAEQFSRQIRFRDYLEGILGFLIAIFFATVPFLWSSKNQTNWVDHWEWFTLSAGALFIAIAFVYQRRQAKQWETDESLDIRQTLTTNLASVSHQIKLLKNIFWWYCLPMEIPLVFVALKSDAFDAFRLEYLLASAILMIAIVGYNWWFVNKDLIPKQAAIKQMLKSMSD